tara:strand:+ start:332 stop:2536 length:2205 start_codon:yes stop_codon:yes gene_type:complete
MVNRFIKIILFISILIILSLFYLSFFGISTNKFNNIIISKVEKIPNLNINFNDIFFKLNILNLEFKLSTSNPKIYYSNNEILLESLETNVSLTKLLKDDFVLKNLVLKSKSNNIKGITKLIRSYKNNFQTLLLDKLVNNGRISFTLMANFDRNGNLQDNFLITGNIEDLKIKTLNKNNLNANFSFKILKDFINLTNANFKYLDYIFKSKSIIVKKNSNNFVKVNGDLFSKKIEINKKDLKKIISLEIDNFIDEKINISTENTFSFDINKKYNISNLELESDNNLVEVNYLINNNNIKRIFNIENKIKFSNHNIKISYKGDPNKKLQNEFLKINGSGNVLSGNKSDRIQYKYNTKNSKNNFKINFQINENPIKLDSLDYYKSPGEESDLYLDFSFEDINNFNFNEILFTHKENKFTFKNLFFKENKIKDLKKLELNYFNLNDKKNKIKVIKSNNKYKISGVSFDGSKLLNNIFNRGNSKKIFYSLDSEISIDIDKLYIDDSNFLKVKNGEIVFNDNEIIKLNIISTFANNSELFFKIFTKNDEKITIISTDYPKPLIKRYKFIKGFEEGVLDFKSIKKNGRSNSTLIIDNFKVKEIPILAKILALASLQGIADILTGEGIRFTDFEMKFSNEKNLMKIEEIYAIGPAISLMISGYIVENELVSLKGTLVPATTINRTISSIPVLGDILIGKKVGEGVFGVSFKVKGPPKDLKTTVNPIKTLTPRFITRTLEKIKN